MKSLKSVPDPWVYFPACVMMALLIISGGIALCQQQFAPEAGAKFHLLYKGIGGIFAVNMGILILGMVQLSQRQHRQRLAQVGQCTDPES